jgi:hypothetical protein
MPSKGTRVVFLLTLLAVVALWGWGRTRTRRARTEWRQPVVVGVLVSGDVGPAEVEALRTSLEAIGDRLTAERDRWLPGHDLPVFTLDVRGPFHPEHLPPAEAPSGGWIDRLLHAWELHRAEREIFAQAPAFDPALVDLRVHVLAVHRGGGAASTAEGIGEAGGEVGVVRATFDGTDAFLAATATIHEALHCLGATDKYDAAGHAVAPDGLAEPGLVPLYPQRFAELMVGEVPTGPSAGRLPSGPGELAIGPATAAEIGWIPPSSSPGSERSTP